MADLTELHQDLAKVVVAERSLQDLLDEITGIARRAMIGSEAASITLMRGDRAFTAAYDGQMALDADELQYERGYGPCMDAGRAGLVFLVDDMRTEERWPDYARRVSERGIGSSLSVPLPFQSATIGGLNTYSSRPHAFVEEDVALGEEVATWIALAVSRAEASDLTNRELQDMRTAMISRATIEQAKGVLVERFRVTPDQAFMLLSHASQITNIKLREVADDLVRTGVLAGSSSP